MRDLFGAYFLYFRCFIWWVEVAPETHKDWKFSYVYFVRCSFCRNEKGLLNFVSERMKLVYRINNTRYNFLKNKLPFKHLKSQFGTLQAESPSIFLDKSLGRSKETLLAGYNL